MINLIQEDLAQLLKDDFEELIEGKTVLITGASGLMGTYYLTLFQELIKQKRGPNKIFVSTSSGIFFIPLLPDTKVIKGNLCNLSILESIPNVDLVIHCAGYAQPSKFLSDPFKTIELNTSVTISLIKKLNPAGQFLFLSSSEIYSGLEKPPFNESQIGLTNTDHPRASYIESKKAGEVVVNIARSNLGISAYSIRLSLAYGPGTKPNDSRVLNSIIDQSITGRVTLKDSGDAWRTYCYVSDAVHMSLDVLRFGKEPCYNIGGVSRIQIRDLAREIALKCSATLEIPDTSQSFLIGAPDEVSLDLTKIMEISKLRNFVELSVGLDRTIEWQKYLQIKIN